MGHKLSVKLVQFCRSVYTLTGNGVGNWKSGFKMNGPDSVKEFVKGTLRKSRL